MSMRGASWRRRFPSETAASQRILCVHGSRCPRTCVHTVKSDVPLDSVFVWFAVRCLSFVSVVPPPDQPTIAWRAVQTCRVTARITSTKYAGALRRNGVLGRDLKYRYPSIDLQCRLFQVCACAYEGCNIRNPFADAVQIGLEVYRQQIAVTTSGMELMGGGSRRLPCIVRNEDMGNWIWICEGLVIVFLTKTLPPTAVVGESGQRGRSDARASMQELATHPSSEKHLAQLKQENAHRSERRVIKCVSNSHS